MLKRLGALVMLVAVTGIVIGTVDALALRGDGTAGLAGRYVQADRTFDFESLAAELQRSGDERRLLAVIAELYPPALPGPRYDAQKARGMSVVGALLSSVTDPALLARLEDQVCRSSDLKGFPHWRRDAGMLVEMRLKQLES